jgi:ribokinase
MPLAYAERLIDGIREAAPDVVLTLDTHEDEIAGKQQTYARLLPKLTAFLPSREEVRTWFGFDDPLRALPSLSGLGQRLTIIKMGHQGALVHDAEAGATWRVPAYQGPVIDPTGAGDAFCGGFLAGLSLGDDPPLATRRGVVSASYAIATHGVPKHPPAEGDAEGRLRVTRAERLTSAADVT